MSVFPRVASRAPLPAGIAVLGALTVAAGLASVPSSSTASSAVSVPEVVTAAPAPVATPTVAPSPRAPEVASRELMLVFRAGAATYMKLADLQSPGDQARGALAMPRHGKLRHTEDDHVEAAIAPVATQDVPAAYARWTGRTVKVDNTCEASVVGFAVVARTVGDPGYAGLERWNAASVMQAGHAVLAAKLDRCTGRFARDRGLPDVVVPTRLRDPSLEDAARAALIGSDAGRATQREWDQQSAEIGAERTAWHVGDAISAEVLRDPRTGVTFVSAHGHVDGGCGAPQANVWGLFRVSGGMLVPVQLRQLGDLASIDLLIDIDGDGELELIGKRWLGLDDVLVDARGTLLDDLVLPFHGCPC